MDNKLKYQIITENENCIYYKILYQNKNYFAKHYKKIKNIKMIYNEINILKELTGLNVPKIINYNIQKKYIIYNYISGQNLNHLKDHLETSLFQYYNNLKHFLHICSLNWDSLPSQRNSQCPGKRIQLHKLYSNQFQMQNQNRLILH